MQVPISEVIVKPREKEVEVTTTIFEGLKGSMKKNGQLVPILVDQNMTLIDGLLRLDAASELGWEKVEVEVADTYEGFLANLTKAHSRGLVRRPLTPRRIWEIYVDSVELMRARVTRIRRMNTPGRRAYAKETGLARNPLPTALGVSHNMYQASRMIYAGAQEKGLLGDLCREEVEKLDQGLTYPSTSLKRLRMNVRKIDGVTDVQVQRNVLNKVMIHLRSIDSALATLGPLSEEVTQDEVDEWLRTLYTSNTTLFRLRAVLRKERYKQ